LNELPDPVKYNQYRKDSQWMLPERSCQTQLQSIMNGPADAATGAMVKSQQAKQA
jgi:hypothetical protein